MIETEIARIPELAPTGIALVRFALALTNGQGAFEAAATPNLWVMRPNFVTLTIQHAQARTIVFTFRGNPDEFEADPLCPLRAAQAGYSRCTLESPRHLLAFARYIDRAFVIHSRGRTRDVTTPVTNEIRQA
jgi:hypothetical protein